MKDHALLNFAEAGMNHTKLKIWLQYIIGKLPSVIAWQGGTPAHPGGRTCFGGRTALLGVGEQWLEFGYLRGFHLGLSAL